MTPLPGERTKRRGITMTSETKILVAKFPAPVSNWKNSKSSGGSTRVDNQIDSERQGRFGRGRGPDAAGPPPAGASQPDRHPCRLRHQPVRRLRGAYRRPGSEILHGA